MAAGCSILEGRQQQATWKVASRDVAPDLVAHVRDMQGYLERVPGRLQRRELPGNQVVVILQLGDPIGIQARGSGQPIERSPRAFVAGLDEHYSLTEFDREQRGLQLNLTPRGARQLLGVPLHTLQGRVVPFEDLVSDGALFLERLAEAPDWPARFDLVEALVRGQGHPTCAREPVVRWAVDRVVESGGRVDIGALSREVGYSHKHLIALFRDHVGLPPKRLAQLVRFERLTGALRSGHAPDAQLARYLGFADQAHLARETRRYAGLTPGELARHVLGG